MKVVLRLSLSLSLSLSLCAYFTLIKKPSRSVRKAGNLMKTRLLHGSIKLSTGLPVDDSYEVHQFICVEISVSTGCVMYHVTVYFSSNLNDRTMTKHMSM